MACARPGGDSLIRSAQVVIEIVDAAAEAADEARRKNALNAVQDVLKQLATVDAALLTFGITYVQDIVKPKGPSNWVLAAISALLLSLLSGGWGLFAVVDQTNRKAGSIDAPWLRLVESVCLIAFGIAVFCIAVYVVERPIG